MHTLSSQFLGGKFLGTVAPEHYEEPESVSMSPNNMRLTLASNFLIHSGINHICMMSYSPGHETYSFGDTQPILGIDWGVAQLSAV